MVDQSGAEEDRTGQINFLNGFSCLFFITHKIKINRVKDFRQDAISLIESD